MIIRILRILPAAGAFAASAALLAAPAAAQSSVGITINGSYVNVYPAPIVQAGRVFVPLRGVFEQLGASVVYDNGQINATENGTDVSLQIGSTQATVNGATETIDVAPFIVGASTYVPLRFISQSLGASVSYDDANRVVAISTAYGQNQDQGPQQPPSFSEAGYDVNQPPPPIPEYDQPPVPAANDIWQPGCWAWSPSGYYWVPGTWVQPPQPNLLWTPGFWSFALDAFGWHPGYWAPQVGFYGGINYGGGYTGQGYQGGRWDDGAFRYNSAVSNVTNTTVIKNTYVYNTVVNNYTTNRTSYNGGADGIAVRPTAEQERVAQETHVPITPAQREHAQVAAQDRRLLATVNAGKPPVVVAPHPYTAETKPAEFVPVTSEDKAAAEKMIVHPHPAAPVARPVENHAAPTHPEDVTEPGRPEPARTEPARPEDATPPVRPETERTEPARPENAAPPVRPETAPTPFRPRVAPATLAPFRPRAVAPPVIPRTYATPRPAVRPPVPHPQVVRPVPPRPAVHPVPHPATPHPAPKPEHTPH